jgi:lysyl-tRNA synthetase class 2
MSHNGSNVILSDALSRLNAHLSRAQSIEPGFLIVLDGTWDGASLRDAELVWSQACPEPNSKSEHSRLAFEGVGPRLEQRAEALKVARRYFEEQSFIEVETPTRLRAPGLDAHIEPISAADGWLVTSPELHLKRLIVGGMPRVFEFARCHRAEELGRYHEPEFTLLEWYRAFEPVESVMRDTEELVRNVTLALSNQTQIKHREFTVRVDPPFARLSVADAFERHANGADGLALAELDPDAWFNLWVEMVEPALACYEVPVFVTDYPAPQAALARKKTSDPRVAERFELYCAGVELCNGYGELTDPDEQLARFESELATREQRGLPTIPLDARFIDALREGLPPCSGNALGFDRLVMLATGADSIADVQAFPWNRN